MTNLGRTLRGHFDPLFSWPICGPDFVEASFVLSSSSDIMIQEYLKEISHHAN
jgi:hypothetical protein